MLSASGCFLTPKKTPPPPLLPDRPLNPAEIYTLACPDVIEVIFADRPQLGPLTRIQADGCIDLGKWGTVHVEGDTAEEAAARIAEHLQIPINRVQVQVAEYNSRQVFLFGPVNGEPRVVDYRGPETVLELLQRAGGLSADAMPDAVYVVRAQLGEGIPAETLTVDLEAIQRRNDDRTNIHVQPLDSIYVGEKPRSLIGRAVPALFKPLYESLVDLIPQRKSSTKDEAKPAK
jgi:protein involved in polysaccharide export with SLBB domain